MDNTNRELNYRISKIRKIICRSCALKFSSFGKPNQYAEFDDFNQCDIDNIVGILQNNQPNINIDSSVNALATLKGKDELNQNEYFALRNKLDESLQRLLNDENNKTNIDGKVKI